MGVTYASPCSWTWLWDLSDISSISINDIFFDDVAWDRRLAGTWHIASSALGGLSIVDTLPTLCVDCTLGGRFSRRDCPIFPAS